MSTAAALEVRAVEKEFVTDDGHLVRALGPLDLALRRGEFAALLGPSGCGKSTLFNVVAGVQEPTAGDVHASGEDVTGKPGTVAYQLQRDLLLGWRTVLDNCLLGPELHGRAAKRAARSSAVELLSRFGLGEFSDAYPRQLSGGMRQRAAFARTLLFERDVILLDEPFGALDAQTRGQMQEWLTDLWEELDKTILLTTHDVDEALFLADTVYVMSGRPGRIVRRFTIDLPRPRKRSMLESSDLLTIKREALEALTTED